MLPGASAVPDTVSVENPFAFNIPDSKSLLKIKGVGDVRFAAISGTFINYYKGRADMLLVCDKVKKDKLDTLINILSAEIGKEIDFVLMDDEEFKYRLNMLDKFVLGFLEGPHEEIINRVSGLKKFLVPFDINVTLVELSVVTILLWESLASTETAIRDPVVVSNVAGVTE